MAVSRRILLVVGFPLRMGGSLKTTLNQATQMAADGHRVWVAAPGGLPEMESEFANKGVPVIYLPLLERGQRFSIWRASTALAQMIRKEGIEVVQAMDFNVLSRVYLGCVRARCPLITTTPGQHFQAHQLPTREADNVVFSRELEDAVQKHYPEVKSRLHLIRARIDLSAYRPEGIPADYWDRFGVPAGGPHLTMAIRLDEYKLPWIRGLLALARRLAGTPFEGCFVLAGEGNAEETIQREIAVVNALRPDKPLVYTVGPIFEVAEIRRFFNASTFVLGNGRALIEGLSCGTPGIVVGENGEVDFVRADNIEEIAYYNFSGRHFRHVTEPVADLLPRLLRLFDLYLEREKLGAFGREYVVRELSAERGVRQLEEIVAGAVSLPKPSWPGYLRWYLRFFWLCQFGQKAS